MNKILLVDDEVEILSALSYLLKRAGYDVDSVTDGVQALEKLYTNQYVAVVCDYIMPKLDGIGLLREVRAEKNFTPFLFLSGHAGHREELEVSSLGAYELIQKPHIDKVIPGLKKLIQSHSEVKILIDHAHEDSSEFLDLLHGSHRKIG